MKELGKYGCQLPQFGKIGGILASELPVDEAALHAVVIAVNEAVEKGVSAWEGSSLCGTVQKRECYSEVERECGCMGKGEEGEVMSLCLEGEGAVVN